MDIQLRELLDKIKNDGVKSAEQSAARIISNAREQASVIVRDAEKEAGDLLARARKEAEDSLNQGRDALRQAGRDLILKLKDEIETLFRRVVEVETVKSLDDSLMSRAILAAVKQLSGEDDGQLDVLLPNDVSGSLSDRLQSDLAEYLKSGVEVKLFDGIDAGFRLANRDGSAFYDFSGKEIAAMLTQVLNPRLAKLVEQSGD